MRTLHIFPYQTLSLILEQEWEGEKEIQKDIITLNVKQQKGSSPSIFYTSTVSAPIQISTNSTKGVLKLYHFMKRESIPGISDIAVKISDN